MNDSIPARKSKSKIKPLENKILSLEEENESLLEEMYEKGIRIRPSIMTQIEEEEAETCRAIKFCIKECEKKTGRAFQQHIFTDQIPF